MSCHCNSVQICEPIRPLPPCNDCCDHKHKHKKQHKKHKACNKCYQRECNCVEYYPCLRTKCGCVSAVLTVQSEPVVYTAAGQVITYIYIITNTGTVPITGPIRIVDNKLGTQIIPCAFIPPCQSQIYGRTYTIIPEDLQVPELTNMVVAYIQVTKHKWIVTQPVPITVTNGTV